MQRLRYYRKIIKVRAEDSPNVKLGLEQRRLGLPVTYEEVVPGVLGLSEYEKRRATWGKMRQCIGLDGEFYDGGEVLLFPPLWLNAAETAASTRAEWTTKRWMGCDPAEGGDWSSWAIIDAYGLIELFSMQTPDTTVIPMQTIALMMKHGILPGDVCFDRGGGGKQAADRLRELGHKVRTVAFGEKPDLELRRGIHNIKDRVEVKEDRGAYFNRRAEMYGEFALLLDPNNEGGSFALPSVMLNYRRGNEDRASLRQQLEPIPNTTDAEGKLKLLPKNNPTDPDDPRTLVKLIGHSPDEADAVVLAVHARLHKKIQSKAGAA